MLDALPELIRLIRSEPDFTRTANIVVTRVPDILGCEVGSLFIKDPISDAMHMFANDGYELPPDQEIIVPAGKGIVGMVAQRYEPLNVRDIHLDPHFYDHPDTADERYRAFLGVPILHRRSVIGVLTAQREEFAFSEDEEGFLTSVAATLSVVIAKALENRDISFSSKGSPNERVERTMRGVAGSPGIVIGNVALIQPSVDLDAVRSRTVDDIDAELHKLDIALASVRSEIDDINNAMSNRVGEEELALFEAYLHILDDDAIAGEVRDEIRANSQWAQGAVADVFTTHIRNLEAANSSYIAERGQDVRDLGERLLASLQETSRKPGTIPANAVVVAHDVTATMLGELEPAQLKGIVTIAGSVNSHSAILARAMNIPAVMGVSNLNLSDIEESKDHCRRLLR